MSELRPDGTVDVYIEGLLVQSREPGPLMHWAENYGMRDIAEELNESFYKKYAKSNGLQAWAYHFKDVNGYVLIKVPIKLSANKPDVTQITVSLNDTDPNAPTLQVVSHVSHTRFSVEYVSSLVALAKYYIADSILLGDSYGKKEE